ncbi:MAG: Trans-hexaprenyltranstransferase [Thermoleophilia bacterium]|nr:Trans-hexaprenyltranstransferase [Thermoleophilia bacterium]MCZ4495611.1 Trans-hexaprenyltranstransferase [Thermoleophilia bacterium]
MTNQADAAPAPRVGGADPASFVAGVETHMLELLSERAGAIAEAAARQVSAGGKRLRPLLVLAARPRTLAAGVTDAAFEAAAVHAGAAVELLHTASLVHDDLLDGAQLRRGVPTIDAELGRDAAVAAGDLLFSVAFATLVDARRHLDEQLVQSATRVLARTSRALAIGEALQARQLRDVAMTEAAYLERCAGKTGVLFAASLQLGATFGGASPDDVAALGRFGAAVGTAFQITDDVLDCGEPGTEALLGKAPGADVRDGTITLPMLHALRLDPELAGALAERVAERHVDDLLQRIRRTGALDSARQRAFELHDEALALLDPLADRFDVEPLHEIADRSVDRLT